MMKYVLSIFLFSLIIVGCTSQTGNNTLEDDAGKYTVNNTSQDSIYVDEWIDNDTRDPSGFNYTENSSDTNNSDMNTVTVEISDFSYNPEVIRVPVNTRVEWIQRDSVGHTVTSVEQDIFASPLLSTGQRWSHTFTQTGEFSYYCVPHPNMRGVVIVE